MFKRDSHINFKFLYNNLIKLVRKKELYIQYKIDDSFTSRTILLFVLVSFLLIRLKTIGNAKKTSQIIFDNIFRYIELNLRELGFGDTSVNSQMKNLTKIFYDILIKCEKFNNPKQKIFNDFLILQFYSDKNTKKECVENLAKFFISFKHFSSKLTLESIKKGDINFVYF